MVRGIICSLEGAGAVGATPSSDAPDLVELDGGPGGSDATVDCLPGTESRSDAVNAESSELVCTLIFTWWETISRSKLARSREMRRLSRSRETRR